MCHECVKIENKSEATIYKEQCGDKPNEKELRLITTLC